MILNIKLPKNFTPLIKLKVILTKMEATHAIIFSEQENTRVSFRANLEFQAKC